MALKFSVGAKATNSKADVLLVQKKLNESRQRFPSFGALQKKLSEDGISGTNTVNAIKLFQSKVLGFKYPDGKVDPNGKTWKKLNANIPSTAAITSGPLHSPVQPQYDNWIPHLVRNQSLTSSANPLLAPTPSDKAASSPNKQPSIQAFKQGDKRWGQSGLGNQSSKTIHGYGCALTCLAMATTYIGEKTAHWPESQTPEKMTPLVANSILKTSGAFSKGSYLLWIVGGAKALGMDGQDSGIRKKLSDQALTNINNVLGKGGLAMAHVDYKKDWVGDHWILITRKVSANEYKAIDPAYGKELSLYTTPDKSQSTQDHIVLYGRSTSMGEKTPEKISKYKVVRYVTLKSQ